MDILISEEVIDPAIDALAERHEVAREPELWRDRARLLERVASARALMCRNMTRVDRELLTAAKRLEVLGRIGVGMDNVDVAAANELGIAIVYPADENAVSVAEHVFAMLLALARKIVPADRSVREGRWERSRFNGFELYGKTMGILGLGRIGFRVATRARAFGMDVLAYDPFLSAHHPSVTEAGARLASLEDVIRGADVLSVHLPLTAETRGLLDATRLGTMKPNAVVVNTSRGQVVDEAALYQALVGGQIAGAALDVREQEPPGESPLHTHPNVVVTPHIASWTHEAHARVISTVAGDVDRVLRGESARYYVNFPRPRRG